MLKACKTICARLIQKRYLLEYIFLQVPHKGAFLQEEDWKYCIKEKRFLWEFAISLVVLIVAASVFAEFLAFAEGREGVFFADPILSLFDPVDFSLITFILTYGSIAAIVLLNVMRPRTLVQMLQLYTLLLVARTITIYLWPLYAPEDIIILADPFLDTFIYQVHNIRDLFFSGHTATVFIFALTLKRKALKAVFIAISLVIGLLLILQHVHYSVDVFAAPLFAYLIFVGHRRFRNRSSAAGRGL